MLLDIGNHQSVLRRCGVGRRHGVLLGNGDVAAQCDAVVGILGSGEQSIVRRRWRVVQGDHVACDGGRVDGRHGIRYVRYVGRGCGRGIPGTSIGASVAVASASRGSGRSGGSIDAGVVRRRIRRSLACNIPSLGRMWHVADWMAHIGSCCGELRFGRVNHIRKSIACHIPSVGRMWNVAHLMAHIGNCCGEHRFDRVHLARDPQGHGLSLPQCPPDVTRR